MVENTLGRVWADHLIGNGETEKAENFINKWQYYIKDTDEDNPELKKIREKRKDLKPTDIKFIDPCMGSGHILVYAFELLVDIYCKVLFLVVLNAQKAFLYFSRTTLIEV